MFGTVKFYYVLITVLYIKIQISTGEVEPPFLALYSPGEPEYAEVLVHRIGENLTLVCELKGDPSPRVFVWNYVNDNGTDGGRTFTVEPSRSTLNSTLRRNSLQVSDSGQYMCSAPPFSVTKYILVQPKGAIKCARGALTCGKRCVLATYVCDGRQDCLNNEDELPPLCGPLPCARVDRLNCSSGRCVPEAACCRRGDPLCKQPSCCDEQPRYARLPGYVEVEYPPLFEDRHAPDDYGFIQSTIYTVTACALIFMVAVVLLVSALCKMHMKRAALRGYALAHRRARDHYAARFPPRYEAANLLEPGAPPVIHPLQEGSAVGSPALSPDSEGPQTPVSSFGLARLSHIFSRYRQVPTTVCDVELRTVRGPTGSAGSSPAREFRSPASHPDLYLAPAALEAPRGRPLTLQLGRFQLSLPRLRPRPDTPDVDDLDLVRLATDTYTLNGRTVRLLGADFENYPALDHRPPPYNEAVRYKTCGPPPEYLSREGIDRSASYSTTESEARNNVEMPPGYDELAARATDRENNNGAVARESDDSRNNNAGASPATPPAASDALDNSDIVFNSTDNCRPSPPSPPSPARAVPESIHSVIESLPAIDSDINANDTRYVLAD
ncbi:uncharacterized protein LOC121727462 [Aricia agestis]|uniref:uncharacterized protein LOC121727462 n=1 Tax=Aricia agestis TaxID=91739 RepID=UPI001C203232|nr:uncharacterized protein LOC121727462 [Aricia agestis]